MRDPSGPDPGSGSRSRLFPTRTLFLLVAGFHLAIGLLYRLVWGLEIAADPVTGRWDFFWQHLPAAALARDPWHHLFWLHAQPPLHNLYGAFLIGLCPDSWLDAMQYCNLGLGALLSGMLFTVLLAATGRRVFAFLAALVLALHPGLFLFEAYPLYTLPATFLVTAAVFWLAVFSRRPRRRYLLLFILTLTLLILTRSLYHLALFAVALPLVALLAGRGRLTILLVALLLALPAAGWYAKNRVQFGFFGSSSWLGLNLWHMAATGYAPEELRALADAGVIEPMLAEQRAFSRPSAYRRYGQFPLDYPACPALDRDDFHNGAIVAISAHYGRGAVRLIRHDPARYLRTVAWAYKLFCLPSTQFRHLARNAEAIRGPERLYAQVICGQGFLGWCRAAFGKDPGSWLVALLPLSLAAFAVSFARAARRDGWRARLRADPAMAAAAALIAYTLAVGCLFECNDNTRFKFMVEPLWWTFALVQVRRAWPGRAGR